MSAQKTTLLATAKLILTAAIWASTYVLARILVREIGPISLGGLRFFTAGLFLVIYLKYRKFDFSTLKGHWFKLCALGVLSFSIGNGCTYFALQSLPSTTVSFLTSFVTPLVLVMGIVWLREIPGILQICGIVIAMAGTALYFYPQRIPVSDPGFLVLAIGILGFAGYTTLGRSMARDRQVHFLAQTAFPLLFGGGVTLILGLAVEGIPVISPQAGGILLWMILVNTLLGYILYNQAIMHLKAIQVNMILNLSPFFTAMIAFFALHETLSQLQSIAMLIVFIGTLLVQIAPNQIYKFAVAWPAKRH